MKQELFPILKGIIIACSTNKCFMFNVNFRSSVFGPLLMLSIAAQKSFIRPPFGQCPLAVPSPSTNKSALRQAR